MEILEAFDLTKSYRAAALLCGVDHHTVAAKVAARAARLVPGTGTARPSVAEPFVDKIVEWVARSDVGFRCLPPITASPRDQVPTPPDVLIIDEHPTPTQLLRALTRCRRSDRKGPTLHPVKRCGPVTGGAARPRPTRNTRPRPRPRASLPRTVPPAAQTRWRCQLPRCARRDRGFVINPEPRDREATRGTHTSNSSGLALR